MLATEEILMGCIKMRATLFHWPKKFTRDKQSRRVKWMLDM